MLTLTQINLSLLQRDIYRTIKRSSGPMQMLIKLVDLDQTVMIMQTWIGTENSVSFYCLNLRGELFEIVMSIKFLHIVLFCSL